MKKKAYIEAGDIYEDSAYHPCLCIEATEDGIWGISLIDGSYPRSEDPLVSGVKKLTVEEAWKVKMNWPVNKR